MHFTLVIVTEVHLYLAFELPAYSDFFLGKKATSTIQNHPEDNKTVTNSGLKAQEYNKFALMNGSITGWKQSLLFED